MPDMGTGQYIPEPVNENHWECESIPPAVRDLLRLAAVCGPVFSMRSLLALAGWSQEDVTPILRRLIDCEVVTDEGLTGEYRFTDDGYREALVAEISPTRQAMLHRDLGQALEQAYGAASAHHSDELAYHFSRSASIEISNAYKAVHYSHISAERAEIGHDWRKAAGWDESGAALIAEYGTACEHADMVGFRARAANAWTRQGEWRRAWRQMMLALQHCRDLQDDRRFAETVLTALRDIDPPPAKRLALVREALDAVGDEYPELSASLYVQMAWFDLGSGAEDAIRKARELMRGGEVHSIASLEESIEERHVLLNLGIGQIEEATKLSARHVARGLQEGDHVKTARSLCRLAQIAARAGDLHRSETAALEALAFARQKGVEPAVQSSLSILCSLALAHAQFDRFDELWGQVAATLTQRLLLARRAELVGDLGGALEAIPRWGTPGTDHPRVALDAHGTLMRIHWRAGREHDARTELGTWSALRDTSRHLLDRQDALACVASALPALGSQDIVRELLAESQGWGNVRFLYTSVVGLDRIRGDLALRLNLVAEASLYYARGATWAANQGAHPELALALAGQAAVARIRGDESGARRLSDRALEVLRIHSLDETLLPSTELATGDGDRLGAPHADLSGRELQVLHLVSNGLTNRQIAQRLQISHHTVSRHVSNVLEKTGASNRAEATLIITQREFLETAGTDGNEHLHR